MAKGTKTAAFATSSRINHDASKYYNSKLYAELPKPNGIDSERIDDVPLLMHWMLKMHIDEIIDAAIGATHGNRQGLSYGQLAV
ncbi:MAG: hypothetical protein KGS73_16145, partial [Chloroflexi bacterium]|nr:hypothetical protein [Chloroflexota bacterium]